MSNSALRWGIIGAGNIAHKLADAVNRSAGSNLVAVASRTPGKAEAFSDKYAIDHHSDYEDLLLRSDIDVAYVATTHNFHYDNALLALDNGKHVLVEKPFTVNADEAQRLVERARNLDLFLMEAIWVRFLPSIKRLRDVIREGTIGTVKYIHLSFGNFAPAVYMRRLSDPKLAGGVTLDMGIYPITLANYLLDSTPKESKTLCELSPSGVDELATYQFKYDSGCIVTIGASFNLLMKYEAMIYGSTGFIDFPGFQQGQTFTVHTHNGTRDVSETNSITVENHENGFVYQLAEVEECIRQGRNESNVMPLDETIATMKLMDAMRAEWDFRYPFE